ncbi:MAG: hypothetical protein ACRDAW_02410 [Metamycoplasmataceae bacterium]
MNKKSLFSIGALSVATLAVPLVVATSCSNEVEVKYIEVTAKLKVSSNISFFEVQANPITKETLDKAFNGITAENLNQFTSLWDSANRKIVLVSKDGYKFGSNESSSNKLDSIKITPTTIKLDITLKATPEEVLQAEVDASPIARATLNKVFDGITDENINQFSAAWDQRTKKIILTAKEGYSFNSGNTILNSSLIITGLSYLDIVAKKGINVAIKEKDLIQNVISMEALQKAFDGITAENYNNFVSIWDPVFKTINLIPDEGYRFGSAAAPQATESSIPLPRLVLNINFNVNVDSNNITRDEMVANPITRATLDKAFVGITDANANAFTSSYSSVASNQGPRYRFTLEAKTGYEFDGINNNDIQKFDSLPFGIKDQVSITYIDVSPKSTADKITEKEVTASPISQLTLEKVFNGISTATYAGLIATWDAKNQQITLTAKDGYKLGTEANPLEKVVSNKITTVKELEISLNPDLATNIITIAELNATPISKATLDKAFIGVTEQNILNFSAGYIKPDSNKPLYTLVLTAKDGYGFSNVAGNQLFSKPFEVKEAPIKYINVVAKANIEIRITDAEVTASTISQVTLNKVFNNITDVNFEQFTSAWNSTDNKITLTAKPGYKFGTEADPKETVISMAIKTVRALNITAKLNLINAGITKDEITGTLTKATLDKAFNGITDADMANFIASVHLVPNNTNLYYFVLTANDGYGFGNKFGNQVASNTFNAITYISVKPSTTPKPITEKELTASPIVQATLEKAFDGITAENFKQFTSAWDDKTKTITLTALKGYKFGDATTNTDKVSIEIIPAKVLEIEAKPTVDSGITIFNLNAYKMTKATLEKAFNGIGTLTDADMNNFETRKQISTTVGAKNTYNIVLKAKEGFVFSDGSTEITSKDITVGIGYINVTKRTNIVNRISAEELSASKIGQLTLEKVFEGINYENFPGLEATFSDVEKTITLKAANDGYKLGTSETDTKLEIVSIVIKPVIGINVTFNPDVNNNGITLAEIDVKPKMAKSTLDKAFLGLTPTDYDNILSTRYVSFPDGNTGKQLYAIILRAKDGYAFNNIDGAEFMSMSFYITS